MVVVDVVVVVVVVDVVVVLVLVEVVLVGDGVDATVVVGPGGRLATVVVVAVGGPPGTNRRPRAADSAAVAATIPPAPATTRAEISGSEIAGSVVAGSSAGRAAPEDDGGAGSAEPDGSGSASGAHVSLGHVTRPSSPATMPRRIASPAAGSSGATVGSVLGRSMSSIPSAVRAVATETSGLDVVVHQVAIVASNITGSATTNFDLIGSFPSGRLRVAFTLHPHDGRVAAGRRRGRIGSSETELLQFRHA